MMHIGGAVRGLEDALCCCNSHQHLWAVAPSMWPRRRRRWTARRPLQRCEVSERGDQCFSRDAETAVTQSHPGSIETPARTLVLASLRPLGGQDLVWGELVKGQRLNLGPERVLLHLQHGALDLVRADWDCHVATHAFELFSPAQVDTGFKVWGHMLADARNLAQVESARGSRPHAGFIKVMQHM